MLFHSLAGMLYGTKTYLEVAVTSYANTMVVSTLPTVVLTVVRAMSARVTEPVVAPVAL